MWKILSLFAALPTCAVVFIYSNREEKKHMEHLEAHGRDPFIAYPHLRSRTKVRVVFNSAFLDFAQYDYLVFQNMNIDPHARSSCISGK